MNFIFAIGSGRVTFPAARCGRSSRNGSYHFRARIIHGPETTELAVIMEVSTWKTLV